MATHQRGNDISPALLLGLVVFVICFIVGLIFWDWHHEKEVMRNNEHHRAIVRLSRGQGAGGGSFLFGTGKNANPVAQMPPYQQYAPYQPSTTPYWGIEGMTVTSQNQFQVNSPIPFGMVVTQIFRNSVLDGLQPGDIIARVDGFLLKDETMFWALVKNKVRGSQLNVSIFRNGQQYNLHFDP
ncbi:MAG: PDZ domain-containing protein [Candidatus Riflebacteria bacterium]|nr:PDZ domain-containing protein [Candidatus Riflebacteria bacterium]